MVVDRDDGEGPFRRRRIRQERGAGAHARTLAPFPLVRLPRPRPLGSPADGTTGPEWRMLGPGTAAPGRPSMRSLDGAVARAWWDRGAALARRVTERLWAVARDPLRVLPVVAVAGAARDRRAAHRHRADAGPASAAMDWRRQSTIDWRTDHRPRRPRARSTTDSSSTCASATAHDDRPPASRPSSGDAERQVGGRTRADPVRPSATRQSVELVGLRQRRPDPGPPPRRCATRCRRRRHRARDLVVPPPCARRGERATSSRPSAVRSSRPRS